MPEVDDADFPEIPPEVAAAIRARHRAGVALSGWRGHGLEALAKLSGVPATRIGRHEAGRSGLSQEDRQAIADALQSRPPC